MNSLPQGVNQIRPVTFMVPATMEQHFSTQVVLFVLEIPMERVLFPYNIPCHFD